MIQAESLRLGYGSHAVLDNLSFQVDRGEFVGLLGPNGSGKSTLLRALSGLLPPQAGQVRVQGQPLAAWPSRERAKLMAVVPQNTDLRFPFTSLEVVLMGRYPHRRRFAALEAEDLVRALESLRQTTTLHLKDRPVTEVSGGEGQRIVIARALAQDPEILLLDEATSSLDVRKKLEIFEILRELHETRQVTVICAMHDLNLAALYCRRLMFLKDGRVVTDGPTGTAFTPEVLKEVYETPMEVRRHPVHGRPYAVMLPLRESVGTAAAVPEARP